MDVSWGELAHGHVGKEFSHVFAEELRVRVLRESVDVVVDGVGVFLYRSADARASIDDVVFLLVAELHCNALDLLVACCCLSVVMCEVDVELQILVVPLSVDVPIEIIGALSLGEFLDSQFYYLLHCNMTFGLYKYTKNVGKRETNKKQFWVKKRKNVCIMRMYVRK